MSSGAPTKGGIQRLDGLTLQNVTITGNASNISASSVMVAAITAPEFSFAGGTLQEFCQAIAEAIPAE